MSMKDGTLSPEELASLTQEVEGTGTSPSQGPQQPAQQGSSVVGSVVRTYQPSPAEIEALNKLATEFVDAVKTGGATFIHLPYDIGKLSVGAVDASYFSSKFSGETLIITTNFSGDISGEFKIVFPIALAKAIASIMTGGGLPASLDSVVLDEAALSALSEYTNITLGALSARLAPHGSDEKIEFSVPQVEALPSGLDPSKYPGVYLMMKFSMSLDNISDEFVVLVSSDMVKSLVLAFGISDTATQQPQQFHQPPFQPGSAPPQQPVGVPPQQPYYPPVAGYQPGAVPPPQQPMQQPVAYPQQPYYPPAYPPAGPAIYGNVPSVRPVQFSQLNVQQPSSGVAGQIDLNLLADIPLEVTVELGRTRRLLEDILNWAPGSVIELNKQAGEHVDVLVNGKRVAKGEVVVIDENFGVRITDIVPPEEILKKLT